MIELGEGYVSVSYTVPAADGGLNERRAVLDVFDAVFELDKAVEGCDDPIEQMARRRKWLHENGVEGISSGDSWALYQQLIGLFVAVKKKALSNAPAETPKPTGSPSGGSGDDPRPPDWLDTL